jgi:hypothetical protein
LLKRVSIASYLFIVHLNKGCGTHLITNFGTNMRVKHDRQNQ